MAFVVETIVNTRGLEKYVRHLAQITAARGALRQAAKEEMETSGKTMIREVYTNLSGRKLQKRSGSLWRSVFRNLHVSPAGQEITLQVGAGTVYGAAQEFGAEATPKHARVMTVPLPAALNGDGTKRFSALEAKQHFDATFWAKDILFGRVGRDIVPLFVAKLRVLIAGGPGVGKRYIRDPLDEETEKFQDRMLARVVTQLTTGRFD